MQENLRLMYEYEGNLHGIKTLNSSFDYGILDIAYDGLNRNGSKIDKAVFERCASTMYNCPIVCNYSREDDSIGGHDVDVVSEQVGDSKVVRLVNATDPVGVVPESATYSWKNVEEEDGTTRNYLSVPVILWKRQEAYRKIKRDKRVKHSMEISIKDYEVENGVMNVNDFEFTAFCLLGDDVEPCFESSAITVFSRDIKDQIESMMSELKSSFSAEYSALINDYSDKEQNMKGGAEVKEEANVVIETGAEEAANFESEVNQVESTNEVNPNGDVEHSAESVIEDGVFALHANIMEEIISAMSVEKVEMPWGESNRYCFVDYDFEKKMVYCYDRKDEWRLFGFAFEMNGDSVVIDFESKKRMKFDIVPFVEGDNENQSGFIIDEIGGMSNAFSALEQKLNDANTELETLRKFKQEKDNEAAKSAIEDVLSKFSAIKETEEFKALVKSLEGNESKFTAEYVEEKCYAILGRNYSLVAEYQQRTQRENASSPKLHVDYKSEKDEPYGGIMLRFPPEN